jgi:hypothetical protein
MSPYEATRLAYDRIARGVGAQEFRGIRNG